MDELVIVCSQCSFPEKCVFVDGQFDHFEYAEGAPADEAEALDLGWIEIEHGALCPGCAKLKAEADAVDVAAGAESGTGMDQLAQYVHAIKKP